MTHVTVRNGLTLAYTVAAVNALLELLISFGISLNDTQHAAIVAFVNVVLMLAARVLHMPEKTPTGTVQVTHVPVLTETPKPPPPEVVVVPPVASAS